MPKQDDPRSHDAWASLRFAIVGPLLASPPRERGELRAQRAVVDLASDANDRAAEEGFVGVELGFDFAAGYPAELLDDLVALIVRHGQRGGDADARAAAGPGPF